MLATVAAQARVVRRWSMVLRGLGSAKNLARVHPVRALKVPGPAAVESLEPFASPREISHRRDESRGARAVRWASQSGYNAARMISHRATGPREASAAPRLALAGSAALALIAFFGEALTARRVFFGGDMQLVVLPARYYLARRISGGELPEWYPYDGLGASFVGSVVTGAFHPFGLLEILGSRALALNASVVLAHAAAALGLYLLLRAWGLRAWPSLGGGLLYAFSGYLSSMDASLPYLLSSSALPWALWGIEAGLTARGLGPLAAGALALASCALAGDPQAFVVGAALCAALAAARARRLGWRRALGRLALMGIWTGLLSAVQALPAALAFGSVVSGLRTLDQVQWHSLAPLRLIELVAAHPFVESAQGVQPAALFAVQGFGGLWEDSLFLGAPALALGLAAVLKGGSRARWLGALAAGSLLFALGRHLPFYALLYRALPFWRAFRFPEKLLAFTALALCALAAWGLQLRGDSKPASRWALAGAVFLALALWAAAGAALLGAGGPLGRAVLAAAPAPSAENLAALWPGLTRQLLLSAALSSAAALALLSKAEWLAALAVPAVALLGNRGLSQSYLAPTEWLSQPPPGLAQALAAPKADVGPLRIRWSEGNYGALFGVESSEGYLPIAGAGQRPRLLAELAPALFDRAFAVAYHLPSPGDAPQATASPGRRIRLARAIAVAGPSEALEAMRSPGFDPVADIVVEGGAAKCGPGAEVSVEGYAEERIAARTRSKADCALFVADGWDAGWSASLDGRPAEVLRADLFGRAILVPEGEHRVEMRYRAPGLRAGVILTLAGGGWIGLTLLAQMIRARRSSKSKP